MTSSAYQWGGCVLEFSEKSLVSANPIVSKTLGNLCVHGRELSGSGKGMEDILHFDFSANAAFLVAYAVGISLRLGWW